jgi:hypothetical protein
MIPVALAGRFLLELGAVASVAIWGVRTGGEGLAGPVLALIAVAILVGGWGLLIAPKAPRSPIPIRRRTPAGGLVMLVAAGLLAIAGETVAAATFAALVVLDTGVLVVAGGTSAAP